MSENSSDEDEISPVFAFRADNIMQKQREAYEEMLKKAQDEDCSAKPEKDEEKELLIKIREKLQKKPRGKRRAVTPPPEREKDHGSLRRSPRGKKKVVDLDVHEDKKSKMELISSPINLLASSKKRLKKINLKNEREMRRIEILNKRALNSCFSSSADDLNASLEIETEQNITLKINYLTEVSKITVGENEKFSSIISKVANLFNLKNTEITLCLRTDIISLDDSPHTLKVKSWETIDCVPCKPAEKMEDEDSNKILIKMQSNDSKKKIDIYAHKLEKFKDIKEQYAKLRKLPLKDLLFEFDGERIGDSETPNDLDMESGSCVDVKVIGSSLKPSPPSIPVIDIEKEEPHHKMLEICVLD